jgi:uncharacterized protein YutE (UPF0331/DUF86 family)
MRLELYQQETARLATLQATLLAQAAAIAATGRPLTALEQSGMLHALQILVENAIGKAKQILKDQNLLVPVSAYDAFAALAEAGLLPHADLPAWNAVVGLRNRIVHDYMNINMELILQTIASGKHQFVVDFLLQQVAPKSK